MNKLQARVISEMQNEIEARKHGLLAEREQLSRASSRIADIDIELALWDVEKAAYEDDKAALPIEEVIK
jgi:hypothetical protein